MWRLRGWVLLLAGIMLRCDDFFKHYGYSALEVFQRIVGVSNY